jgi:hypothetical protein
MAWWIVDGSLRPVLYSDLNSGCKSHFHGRLRSKMADIGAYCSQNEQKSEALPNRSV